MINLNILGIPRLQFIFLAIAALIFIIGVICAIIQAGYPEKYSFDERFNLIVQKSKQASGIFTSIVGGLTFLTISLYLGTVKNIILTDLQIWAGIVFLFVIGVRLISSLVFFKKLDKEL